MGVPGRGGAAGHQPEAQGHRLGGSYGAEFSLPVGGKRLGQVGKAGQLQRVCVPLVTRRAYSVYCMRQRLDTLFDGDLAAAVHALVSESGCSQSALEQAIRVLEEKHQETEEYDLYDPYG